MKIVIFEHNKVPFPVLGYGGGPRIFETLYKGLIDGGHDVTLIIIERTTLNYGNGKIIQLTSQQINGLRFGQINLNQLLNNEQFDIFYCSCSGDNANLDLKGFNGKVVTFFGGNRERFSGKNIVFISYAQFCDHLNDFNVPDKNQRTFVCYPGIDENNLILHNDGPHDRVVYLSSISMDKGTHFVSRISQIIGEKVIVAGNIVNQNYFNECIQPEIGKTIEYYGEISDEKQKSEFFSKAKVYIHLSSICEPFGITSIEAQMCGVPVVSFNRGSAIEVNYSKEFVFNFYDEIAMFIKSGILNKINRQKIRNYAINNFGKKAFTDRTIKIFQQILNNKNENSNFRSQ